MLYKKNDVDDRSRNGSNAANSPKREIVTLMMAVEKTAGEPNHANGYSIDVMANFFRKQCDFSEFIICYNDEEILQVNQLFERIADSLNFNVYLQRKVLEQFKGKFTADQLACIFQAFNGIWLQYVGKSDVFAKQELFDYIDFEGREIFDLGDVEAFKGIVKSINPLEFDVFVNVVLEFWGMNSKMVEMLFDYLKKDGSDSSKKQIPWFTILTHIDAVFQA